MTEFILAVFSLLWLGILTSISPCPLATNIAAISYVSKNTKNSKRILLSGLLYSLGRTAVYIIISILIVNGLAASTNISYFMQNYILKILGPILIIIGMFLIDLLELNFLSFSISEKTGKKYADKGLIGTFVLGCLFALSFCPVSAALFFGGMIPIAVKFKSSIILPFFYGLGTAAPVVLFAFMIVAGMKAMDKALIKIGKIEKVMKYATGYLFILIGIYLTLVHIFNMEF
jgi:cytochrome c-type biogenesis protein